ncbi:MAG: extracellular solute-binding protein, partial [Chloroflexota bacterium]|nr:extracellular solute-binding protein [Chloroflexota bacterium]
MIRRRPLTWVMIALLLLAGAAPTLGRGGAVAAQDAPSGSISFGFWGDPAELRAYQAVADAFQATQPNIEIEINHVPNADDFQSRLATGFAAGDPPDVFLI